MHLREYRTPRSNLINNSVVFSNWETILKEITDHMLIDQILNITYFKSGNYNTKREILNHEYLP